MPWLKQFFGTPHKTWPHCSVEGCCLWKAVSPHDPKFLRSALTIKCGCLSQNLATHLLGCWFFVIPKFIFQNPNFSFFHRGIWSACTSKADYAWWNIHEMVFKWQPAWFFRCCQKKQEQEARCFAPVTVVLPQMLQTAVTCVAINDASVIIRQIQKHRRHAVHCKSQVDYVHIVGINSSLDKLKFRVTVLSATSRNL